jgi:hypothetical protein
MALGGLRNAYSPVWLERLALPLERRATHEQESPAPWSLTRPASADMNRESVRTPGHQAGRAATR